jgi:hypothetical protein
MLRKTLVILCLLALLTFGPAPTGATSRTVLLHAKSPDGLVASIAGGAATCKCCIQEPVADVCVECSGTTCTCDFDILGLPRCTSG